MAFISPRGIMRNRSFRDLDQSVPVGKLSSLAIQGRWFVFCKAPGYFGITSARVVLAVVYGSLIDIANYLL